MRIRYNNVNETKEELRQERKEFMVSTLVAIALMGSVIIGDIVTPKDFRDKMDNFYHSPQIEPIYKIGLR